MLVFFIWALVAGRLGKWSVTAPLAMVIAGIVLTAGANPVFIIELETSSAETGIEVVLAILLFLAIPLSLGLAWLAGLVLFPDESPWLLVLLATVVIPLDLAPAGPVLRD